MKDQHATARPPALSARIVRLGKLGTARTTTNGESRVLLLNERRRPNPLASGAEAHRLPHGSPAVAPVVSSPTASVHGVLCGLLVHWAHPAAVSAAITKLLADPEARRRMSRRALAWSANFDWEESASAVLQAIRRAAGRGSSRSVARIHAPTDTGRSMSNLPVAAAGRGGSP